MVVFYLDTSALLKRYRSEKGTDVVNELYEPQSDKQDSLVTSHFSCLEVESVAARALKGKRIDRRGYAKLLGAFGQDLERYLITLPVSSSLLTEAAEAVRRYAVRAPDSIHLASAERTRSTLASEEFVFVASDRELIAAAYADSMDVLDPESEDALALLRGWRNSKR